MPPSTRYIFVDVDNISFYDSQHNMRCLEGRVHRLFKKYPSAQFAFFGNAATKMQLAASLKDKPQNSSVLQHVLQHLRTTDVSKDSADHALVNELQLLLHHRRHTIPAGSVEVSIVTSDKSLARLVTYFWTNEEKSAVLSFLMFKNAAAPCATLVAHDKNRFPLHFNDKADLDAFIRSLSAFSKRYASVASPPSSLRSAFSPHRKPEQKDPRPLPNRPVARSSR